MIPSDPAMRAVMRAIANETPQQEPDPLFGQMMRDVARGRRTVDEAWQILQADSRAKGGE